MLRGNKSEQEVRFELIMFGALLIAAALMYVMFADTVPGLMLFIPGLILLGSAIYQDMQTGWKAGWITYAIAILMVATGLAGIVNTLVGDVLQLNWVVITAVELGAILIAKALFDPQPN